MNSTQLLPHEVYHLEQVLNNISDGYIVYDEKWQFICSNPQAAMLTGIPQAALQEKSLFELFPGLENNPAFIEPKNTISRKQESTVEYFSHSLSRWLKVKIVSIEKNTACFISDISENKKLEENTCYLGAITDSIEEALIRIDDKYRITSWNASAEKMYGWSAEEATGKISLEILKTRFGAGQSAGDVLRKVIKNNRWEGEVKHHRKDGAVIGVRSRVSALRNERDELIGLITLNRDITAEKKAEEAQMQLSAIVESSQDAIVSKNLKGVIKTWNRAAEKIFGYTAAEMIGKHITTIIPPELIHEEDNIISKIKKGIPIDHFDTVRLRKDGSRVNISLTISPIRDTNGRIIGASKIARDITERTQAEKALRDSEEQLRAMFNQAGVGVCLIGRDYSLLEVNPKFCEILGHTENELADTSWTGIIYPDDRESKQKILDELAGSGKETATFETRCIRNSGPYVWVRVTIAKIHDQHHLIQQYVAIVEDISEHKRAEAGLRESESRFRILAENIQNMAWMANPDGWIFWCNQRWYEYLGSSFEAIKGWGWEQTLHPDHSGRVHEFLSTAWKNGEPWELTFPLRSKNGDYRWFHTSAYPVRDSNGELLRWIGTCTDVNAFKN